MSLLLLALTVPPLVGSAAELGLARRNRHRWPGGPAVAGACLALGAACALAVAVALDGSLALGPIDAPWLAADGLTVVISLVVASIGCTVLAYGRRSLDPGPEAVRLASAGSAMLAATLAVAAAGRLSVLVGAWLATTAILLTLLHRSDDPGRLAATRRALRALGPGDLALVAAATIVMTVGGDLGLGRLGTTTATLAERQQSLGGLATVSALDVVAVLLVLTALARASQLPFPTWLQGTLATPTPTSALLHAGVVNAGAIVLLRTFDVVGAAPAALWLLAVASMATIVVSVASLRTRHDTKGALATSTSAQMGFMLLAIAVGAPMAAITHLVGHALYKSARFLGAGDAIGAAVRRRSDATPHSDRWSLQARLANSLGGAAIAALAVTLVVHGAEAWMLGAAMAASAGTACWALLGRAPASIGHLTGVGSIVALSVSYVTVAAVLERVVAGTAPEVTTAPIAAPAALTILAMLVVGLTLASRHPTLAPRLASTGSSLGRPRLPRAARPSPTISVAPIRIGAERSSL